MLEMPMTKEQMLEYITACESGAPVKDLIKYPFPWFRKVAHQHLCSKLIMIDEVAFPEK
jgi:hypothetical protein